MTGPGGARRAPWTWIALAVAVVLVVVAAIALFGSSRTYRVDILMPSAEGTFVGDSVKIAGRDVGRVDDIAVRDQKALVTVELDDGSAPLTQGSTARISWEAVLNERFLEILPGPPDAPAIASGSRIVSTIERVELDQVLAMLDPKTLDSTNSLVQQVSVALKGREQGLRQTLQDGGPTFRSLGEVLQAVGSDGPAIRDLVTQLRGVTNVLSERDRKVAGTIRQLGRLTSATADQQAQLSKGLQELPSTLDVAKSTLDVVPGAVDATVPLLEDLRPATARLPKVAADLHPVLHDLRPVLQDLRPTLDSAASLLTRTPGLLDTAHETLPGVTDVVKRIQPAVAFLRPYTPELTGWFSNWTSIWAGRDATGNFARPLVTTGPTALGDVQPGPTPVPGIQRNGGASGRPLPGDLVGQPWTDANGDSPQ